MESCDNGVTRSEKASTCSRVLFTGGFFEGGSIVLIALEGHFVSDFMGCCTFRYAWVALRAPRAQIQHLTQGRPIDGQGKLG